MAVKTVREHRTEDKDGQIRHLSNQETSTETRKRRLRLEDKLYQQILKTLNSVDEERKDKDHDDKAKVADEVQKQRNNDLQKRFMEDGNSDSEGSFGSF